MTKSSNKMLSRTRTAGVLLHISSLPGGHGIGDLGDTARYFVDWLHASKLSLWQILPLVPPGDDNSPYSSQSAFAANPLFIDLEGLVNLELLLQADLDSAPDFSADHLDIEAVKSYKKPLLNKAADTLLSSRSHVMQRAYRSFKKKQDPIWLDDAAVFSMLREKHNTHWWSWPEDLKNRKQPFLQQATADIKAEVERYKVLQFLFDFQWHDLKKYAEKRGVRIIGDVPMYVAMDSADVWCHPELFKMDEFHWPQFIAGVPPDYFSKTGQMWGNPVFNWINHESTGFKWWMSRLKRALSLCDLIRLDHFRGFSKYWEIPAKADDARSGKWVNGPGKPFFDMARKSLGHLPFIAEDLGELDDDVHKLRRALGIPGSLVLQFAFGGDAYSDYLPHNHTVNRFLYTGTHDNDTLRGWWHALDENARIHVRQYLGAPVSDSDVTWPLIQLALQSVAFAVIIPMQDFLNLDSSARMNQPGVHSPEGRNWQWRVPSSAVFGRHLTRKVRSLMKLYGRAD